MGSEMCIRDSHEDGRWIQQKKKIDEYESVKEQSKNTAHTAPLENKTSKTHKTVATGGSRIISVKTEPSIFPLSVITKIGKTKFIIKKVPDELDEEVHDVQMNLTTAVDRLKTFWRESNFYLKSQKCKH